MTFKGPIVLIHGWGGSSQSWDGLPWSPSTHIVSYDLPGHGARTAETSYGVRPAAADLIRRLETISGPSVLVGHSLGGQVSALVHYLRPDLVAAECVINPAYGHPDSELTAMQRWFREVSEEPHSAISRFIAGSFSAYTSAATRERILADLVATPAEVLTTYLADEYFTEDSVGFASASYPLLAARIRPVLGIYSGEPAAAFERSVGNPDLVVWPGFGHYAHLEASSAFVRTLTRWLDHLRRGSYV